MNLTNFKCFIKWHYYKNGVYNMIMQRQPFLSKIYLEKQFVIISTVQILHQVLFKTIGNLLILLLIAQILTKIISASL